MSSVGGMKLLSARSLALHLLYISSQRRQSEAAAVHTGDLKSAHTESKETRRQNKKMLEKKNENVKREKNTEYYRIFFTQMK